LAVPSGRLNRPIERADLSISGNGSSANQGREELTRVLAQRVIHFFGLHTRHDSTDRDSTRFFAHRAFKELGRK
jgi:hypothetical protein